MLPGLRSSGGRSGQRPEGPRVPPHLGRPRGTWGPWGPWGPSFLCTHPGEKTTGGCGRPDGTGRGGGAGAALAMVLHRPPAPARPRTFRAHPRMARPPLPSPSSGDPGAGQGGRPRRPHLGRAPLPGARPVTGPPLNYLT